MLMPGRTKFRKQQRNYNQRKASCGFCISFGDYGIYSLNAGLVSARQIESARIAIARSMKRGGKIYITIFPDFPYTKKPSETRMGKGKGNPEEWMVRIRPGRVLFEVAGVSKILAQKAFILASAKLGIRVRFISRNVVL